MSREDLCQQCMLRREVSGWSDPWVHCHHKTEEESLADEVKRLRNVIDSVSQSDFISYSVKKELRGALEEVEKPPTPPCDCYIIERWAYEGVKYCPWCGRKV